MSLTFARSLGSGQTLARGALLFALVAGVAACGSDSPTGNRNLESVTVEGTITDSESVPQAGLFAHLVYGTTVAPIAVAASSTDDLGQYSVTGKVPPDECHTVQIWVLEVETFSAAVESLAHEIVGACGTSTLNIQLSGVGPALN